MASGEPFQVAGLALAAAALDGLWDELDRVDSRFWEVEELEQIRRGVHEKQRPWPWWKVWAQA